MKLDEKAILQGSLICIVNTGSIPLQATPETMWEEMGRHKRKWQNELSDV